MERPFPAYKGDAPYVFVSYAHADAEQVYPELVWLREQGFHIWYDEGISPGSTWRDEVALALTQCKVFLFYITPRSVVSSNCLKEVNFCLSRERKILTVHLEPTELPMGLELSLSDMQAIMRGDHALTAYQTKLADSLRSLLPTAIEPVTIPGIEPAAPRSDETSIAILPFANRNLGTEDDYLCEGIAEELIGGLSKVDGLAVASQLASFRFRNKDLDLAAMGAALKVDHILSGSVQKGGSRVRINVLLTNVADGKALWSERYDRELDDIFALQEDVARQVVDALKIEFGADRPARLVDVGTTNARAYELFLLGQHGVRVCTRETIEASFRYFEQAAELDPSFGRAWWCLLGAYDWVAWMPEDERRSRRTEALERAEAVGYDPPIPYVHVRRSIDPTQRPDQRALAHEACKLVRAPDPAWKSFELIQLGQCLRSVGLFRGALDYFERYIDQVSHSLEDSGVPGGYRNLLAANGRFDRAIELWTEVIESGPDDPASVGERSLLYSRTGQYEKSEQDLAVLNRVYRRNFPQFYHLYWRRDLDAARAYFNWLEGRRNLAPIFKCWGCVLLGDIEGAAKYLLEMDTLGMDAGNIRMNMARVVPRSLLADLEQHPRYQELLEKYGIDDAWRDELMAMANELTDITAIHVQLDAAY